MFYKRKYLIAVYDKFNDTLVCICDNIEELCKQFRIVTSTFFTNKSRSPTDYGFKTAKYNFHFIRCDEVIKDIFEEEDRIFKRYYEDAIKTIPTTSGK